MYITFSDGCLGSRNDEERSEMRYVMRIAESVSHQIFERTLHFQVDWKYSCLSVCSSLSLNVFLCWKRNDFGGLWVFHYVLSQFCFEVHMLTCKTLINVYFLP